MSRPADKKVHKIYKAGWLTKKSPGGIPGFRPWQKRYFTIGDKAISYYKKQEDEKVTGVIPLSQIVDVEYIPDKKLGGRFDVKCRNLRIYALNARSPDEAKEWTSAVSAAVTRSKKAALIMQAADKPEAAVKLGKLHMLFWKAKLNSTKYDPGSKEEGKSMMTLITTFPTDIDVLKFILHFLMDPVKGPFLYDMKDDADLSEDEEEKTSNAGGSSGGEGETNEETKEGDNNRKCAVEVCHESASEGQVTCSWHVNRLQTKQGTPASPSSPSSASSSSSSSASASASSSPASASSPPPLAAYRGLLNMLKSQEFLRLLQDYFAGSDLAAHSYAARILWLVYRGTMDKAGAEGEFARAVDIHCSGVRFSLAIKEALLAILLQTPNKVVTTLEKLTIGFYMPVHNPAVWAALLQALNQSDFQIRKSALEDVNAILHDNFNNCRSLRRNKKWQSWVFSLLTDVPKHRSDDVLKNVYAYCINIVTLVHYQYFMKKGYFTTVMTESMTRLQKFSGNSNESQKIGSTLFAALCSKLASQAKAFSQADRESVEWTNLLQLAKCVRKFVFQTAYWATMQIKEEVEEKDGETAASPMTDKRRFLTMMPKGSGEFVLFKGRLAKGERNFSEETPEVTDFGLHWSEDGTAADQTLVQKMCDLYKALRIHEYNPELNPNMQKEEKDFLIYAAKEFEFWEDAKIFLSTIHNTDISELKLLSYRKLSFLVQSFLSAHHSKSDRKSVFNEMNAILKKREKRRQELAENKTLPDDDQPGMPSSPSLNPTSPSMSPQVQVASPSLAASSGSSPSSPPMTPLMLPQNSHSHSHSHNHMRSPSEIPLHIRNLQKMGTLAQL